MRWFTSKAQRLNFIAWVLVTLWGGWNAWADMRESDFLSAGALLFYALIALTLHSIYLMLRQTRSATDASGSVVSIPPDTALEPGKSVTKIPQSPVTMVLVGIILLLVGALGGSRLGPIDPVTPQNAEAKVRTWLEAFNYAIRRLPDGPGHHFALEARNRNGRAAAIVRATERPHYLTIQAFVTIGQEHQRQLGTFSETEANLFVRRLIMDLASFRVGFANINWPLTAVTLEKRVPITATLNEAQFMEVMDAVDLAELYVLMMIPRALEERAHARQQ